jgi:hypothetical protein
MDPKTATKERGGKKICHTFLCSHKCHKIENYFSFEVQKKKNLGHFSKIVDLLPYKLSLSSYPGWVKIRIREKYPGSATLQVMTGKSGDQ